MTASEMDEMDEIFAMADIARRDADAENGQDDMEEDDDPAKFFVNAPCRRVVPGRAVCHALPDGDFHMCFGMKCEHLTLDRERQLVCTVIGCVVGIEHARDHDAAWTGRSVGSANPDDTAGTPLGGWVRRRDMFGASVSAYRNAATISDAEILVPPPRPKRGGQQSQHGDDGAGTATGEAGGAAAGGGVASSDGARPVAKRGALCVDEQPSEVVPSKRSRAARRETWTRDALVKLAVEASHVISALLIVDPTMPTGDGPTTPASSNAPPPKLDPRLQNLEFVRTIALRKYVRACSSEGRQPLNLDVLHNVYVHANEFVRSQRQQAAAAAAAAATATAAASATTAAMASEPGRTAKRRGPGFSGQVRNVIGNLIVCLWRAVCVTPHMRDNKRGNDSFRPFAAGVLYSFKRGVYLNDGTCVVPALEALAVHLPALRSPQSTAQAKQLQSSSHRGICSFHRSIASMEPLSSDEMTEARRLFSDAAGQAAFLRALVHQEEAAAAAQRGC